MTPAADRWGSLRGCDIGGAPGAADDGGSCGFILSFVFLAAAQMSECAMDLGALLKNVRHSVGLEQFAGEVNRLVSALCWHCACCRRRTPHQTGDCSLNAASVHLTCRTRSARSKQEDCCTTSRLNGSTARVFCHPRRRAAWSAWACPMQMSSLVRAAAAVDFSRAQSAHLLPRLVPPLQPILLSCTERTLHVL